MSKQVWEPVKDGQYAAQHNGAYIEIDRDYLKVFEPLLGRDYGNEAEVGLPDNLRLCRLVDAAPAIPPEVAATVREALTMARNPMQYSDAEIQDAIDAALAWLEETTSGNETR